MIPEDYKSLASEIFNKIKPLITDQDTTNPDQLAAKWYLTDQGISLETAIKIHVECFTHRCFSKDGEMHVCQAHIRSALMPSDGIIKA